MKSRSEQATKKYCCWRRSSLPCGRRVLRVEDLRDVLRERLRRGPPRVVAGVEDLQVERPRRRALHSRSVLTRPFSVARDHVVVGDAQDAPARHPAGALGAVVVVRLGVPAEVDGDGRLRVRELPRRAQRQPVVGLLHLPAVDERLAEDAVLVADAVADAGHVHRRERVDEARREPAEAAVAEARLDLRLAQLGQVDAQRRQALLDDLVQVGREQRVVQLPAQEELRRQVRDGLGLDWYCWRSVASHRDHAGSGAPCAPWRGTCRSPSCASGSRPGRS